MGKLLFAALLGGVVAAILTFFLSASLLTGEQRAATDARVTAAESLARDAAEKADVAAKRADMLQKRVDSTAREQARAVGRLEQEIARRPASASDGAVAPASAEAPDGTPWVSRAELDAAIAKARGSGVMVPVTAEPKKTLEELAQELNFSASEEASVRQVLRESEEEAIKSLFGDRPLTEIRDEVKAAREDPERMQGLITETISRGFANVGKLMTLESRTRKKVENVLGPDRAKDFLNKPRRPVLEQEYGELLQDTFKVE